ncbi:uncharacterized protein At4g26485-like [Benincasa hispida]|uniref:uncharacterized protein At4g26485-like n=1 Tax=Benincasa hispida TaxID=102211 RepID=UPI001900D610|nr:uncharacterized protein At4g26485-like [Benincasa hispida]
MELLPENERRTESSDEENDEEEEVWRKHYSSRHRILLVGEGDFSFALCLAKHFGSARNIVATCLDSQDDLEKKYSDGLRNVRELEERGCLVFYGIDVRNMSTHFFLRTQRFDRIIYNFPHVGFLFREDSFCQIQLNKELVEGFLKNARVLLKKVDGEIHVSHKEGEPYNKWELVEEAMKLGLKLQETVPFYKNDYPGYQNKRADGGHSNAPFWLGDCCTYKFKLNQSA